MVKKRDGLADKAIKAGQPLIAAVYDRVSLDKRKQRKSVREQDTENREACDDAGWVILRSYIDNDTSASRFATKERQDWPELLKDLEAGRFHVLVVWEVSRADRDFLRWVAVVEKCRGLGVWIHVTSHEKTYDPANTGDWKVLMLEGIDAAQEPERTSKRVSRDARAAALTGKPHGRLLFGYRREYRLDEDDARVLVGQFIDDTPRTAVAADGTTVTYTPAELVREMAAQIAKGRAARAVAADLNRRGIPTPQGSKRGWTETAIRDMVTNPGYVGRRVYDGKVIPDVKATWPPLLDVRVFEACVATYSDPARRKSRSTAIVHLGSGLFRCGVCGSTVRVGFPRGVASYECWPIPAPAVGPKFCVGRRKDRVDDYVQRSVWLRLARDDIADLLAEDVKADERMAELQAAIVEKQGRLDAARDAYARVGGDIEGLMRIEAALQPEIEGLRSRVNEARIGPVLQGLVGGSLEDVEAEWWRRSLPERREVIRAVTLRVEILQLGKGRRSYSPEESVRIVWR